MGRHTNPVSSLWKYVLCGPDSTQEEVYSETTQHLVESLNISSWTVVTAGLWSGLYTGGGVLRDHPAPGREPVYQLLNYYCYCRPLVRTLHRRSCTLRPPSTWWRACIPAPELLLVQAFGPDSTQEEVYSETTQHLVESLYTSSWTVVITAGLWSGLYTGGGVLRDHPAPGREPVYQLLNYYCYCRPLVRTLHRRSCTLRPPSTWWRACIPAPELLLLLQAFGPDSTQAEVYSETTQHLVESLFTSFWTLVVTAGLWSGLYTGGGLLAETTQHPVESLYTSSWTIIVTAGLWSGLYTGGGLFWDHPAPGGELVYQLLNCCCCCRPLVRTLLRRRCTLRPPSTWWKASCRATTQLSSPTGPQVSVYKGLDKVYRRKSAFSLKSESLKNEKSITIIAQCSCKKVQQCGERRHSFNRYRKNPLWIKKIKTKLQ